MESSVLVTYYHHSGFSVKVGKTLLIFDYWRGENDELRYCGITASDLTAYEQVLVFVSHDHPDHFDEIIYSWDVPEVNIAYLVADDFPNGKRGKRIHPLSGELRLGNASVSAYESTDKGVSFYVQIDGVRIFHAGDLNLWHWREESTLREIAKAEADFARAMAPIEKLSVDIAFFPLDPRMGGLFDAGANHFIMSVKPRVFIPMHWFGRKEVAFDYSKKAKTRYTEIIALTEPRESAEITFRDTSLTWRMTARSDKNASPPLDTLSKDDPFTGSDLPVTLDISQNKP